MKASIDPEFAKLCPKQTEDELELLRESLKSEGCRDPIVCWQTKGNPILDGMTRFTICLEEEINFDLKLIKLSDRPTAECWILQNQLARRNLSDTQRAILRGKLYNSQKRGKTEGLKTPENIESAPVGQICPTGDAAARLAAKEGVSDRTIRREGALAEAVEKLTETTRTQIAGTKVEDSMSGLKQLAKLPAKQQEAVAKLLGSGKAKNLAQAKRMAGIADKPAVKPLTGPKARAAEAQAQVKIWADAVSRWLGQSPSIDEYRNQYPSRQGDKVVKLATDFYEALKNWQKAIK